MAAGGIITAAALLLSALWFARQTGIRTATRMGQRGEAEQEQPSVTQQVIAHDKGTAR